MCLMKKSEKTKESRNRMNEKRHGNVSADLEISKVLKN